MFGQVEPQPDLDTVPHAAGCVYHAPHEWSSDEPECSEGCVEAWVDARWSPQIRRAS